MSEKGENETEESEDAPVTVKDLVDQIKEILKEEPLPKKVVEMLSEINCVVEKGKRLILKKEWGLISNKLSHTVKGQYNTVPVQYLHHGTTKENANEIF